MINVEGVENDELKVMSEIVSAFSFLVERFSFDRRRRRTILNVELERVENDELRVMSEAYFE